MSENTPVAGEVTAEERQRAATEAQAAQERSAPIDEGKVEAAPVEARQRFVAFVTHAQFANHSFLVKPGTPVKAPLHAGAPIGIQPLSHREGDVFAHFSNNVCTTDDPDVIAWCEKHPEICRPASDPRTRAWVQLKSGQIATGSREALIEAGMNVDELLFGDRSAEELGDAVLAGGRKDDVVAGARAGEEKANKDAEEQDPDRVRE